jgi:hypothetical protein
MTKVKALPLTLVLKAKFLKPYTMIKKAVFWVSICVKLFMAY